MSEFKVEKPGFYWQRCGSLAWVSGEHGGEWVEWVVHCGCGSTRYLVPSSGIRNHGIECDTDLVEYIGPTMPGTMTRPEPEKEWRLWTDERVKQLGEIFDCVETIASANSANNLVDKLQERIPVARRLLYDRDSFYNFLAGLAVHCRMERAK